jgi:hypothetical protein
MFTQASTRRDVHDIRTMLTAADPARGIQLPRAVAPGGQGARRGRAAAGS